MSPNQRTGNYSWATTTSGAAYEASNQTAAATSRPNNAYITSYPTTTAATYSRTLQPISTTQSYYNSSHSSASSAPVYSPNATLSAPSWSSTQSSQATPSVTTNHGRTSSYPYLSPGEQHPSAALSTSQPAYTYPQSPQTYAMLEQPTHTTSYSLPMPYASNNTYATSSSLVETTNAQSQAYHPSQYGGYPTTPIIQLPEDHEGADDYMGDDQIAEYSASPSPSATSPGRYASKTPSRTNSGKEKPTFKCEREGCTSNALFTRIADLQRHHATVHNDERAFPCPVKRCSRIGHRGFSRRDHLTEHLRSYHQMKIPKRGAGQRSAPASQFPTGP